MQTLTCSTSSALLVFWRMMIHYWKLSMTHQNCQVWSVAWGKYHDSQVVFFFLVKWFKVAAFFYPYYEMVLLGPWFKSNTILEGVSYSLDVTFKGRIYLVFFCDARLGAALNWIFCQLESWFFYPLGSVLHLAKLPTWPSIVIHNLRAYFLLPGGRSSSIITIIHI